MISMTGYGKSAIQRDEYEIEIEIKSVNAKFLDFKCYIPKETNYLELPLRTAVNLNFKRGTIELRLRYVDHTKPDVFVNENKLSVLNDALNRIRTACKTDAIPLDYILKEYDVIEYKSNLFNLVQFNKDVIAVAKKAIKNQQISAIKEGISINKNIVNSLLVINNAIEGIDSTIPEFRKQLFEKMKNRILEILPQASGVNIEQRLMQELAIYLDRYDIQEEINRLKEHIDSASKNLKVKAENDMGKTLNFIFQEMHREANTLGSKYSNQLSFNNVLLIKEEIEKCREIIQNVM
jgi:uncharacterized protein (TIGR00255 family)